MNFLIDVQLSPFVARRLTALGHDSAHVRDWLPETTPDMLIWRSAVERRFIMVTKDADYVRLAQRRGPTTALVWLRIGNCTVAEVIALFELNLPMIASEIAAGQKIIEIG